MDWWGWLAVLSVAALALLGRGTARREIERRKKMVPEDLLDDGWHIR